MQKTIPYLRVKRKDMALVILDTKNRRWLMLFFALLFGFTLMFLGFAISMADGSLTTVNILTMFVGLLIFLMMLFFLRTYAEISFSAKTETITLNENYWVGVGKFGRLRKRTWVFADIEEVNIASVGLYKRVEIVFSKKQGLGLNFSPKAKDDAQEFYDILQSWRKGLVPDSREALEVLDELKSKATLVESLKKVENMLYFFGAISLISGGTSLMTSNLVEMHSLTNNVGFISPAVISIIKGLVYLACGFGVRKHSEASLWLAMFVVIAERLYAFVMTKTLGGEWSFSSIFVWLIAFFLLSILWGGVQNIRKIEESPDSGNLI